MLLPAFRAPRVSCRAARCGGRGEMRRRRTPAARSTWPCQRQRGRRRHPRPRRARRGSSAPRSSSARRGGSRWRASSRPGRLARPPPTRWAPPSPSSRRGAAQVQLVVAAALLLRRPRTTPLTSSGSGMPRGCRRRHGPRPRRCRPRGALPRAPEATPARRRSAWEEGCLSSSSSRSSPSSASPE